VLRLVFVISVMCMLLELLLRSFSSNNILF